MELAIEQALKYPWENDGWKKLAIGGVIQLAGSVLSLGVSLLITLMFIPLDVLMSNPRAFENSLTDSSMMMQEVSSIGSLLVSLTYMPFLLGYFWEVLHQNKGHSDGYPPLPEWTGRWGEYFVSGFKMSLFYYILMLPIFFFPFLIQASSGLAKSNIIMSSLLGLGGSIMMFGIYIVYVLLLPFLLVPIYFKGPSSPFFELFDFNQMLTMGKKHYGDIFLTLIIVLVIQIVFGIASLIFGVITCCIGFFVLPVANFGLMISNGLMLLHAYEQDKPEAPNPLTD
jgi:hypothetical protein